MSAAPLKEPQAVELAHVFKLSDDQLNLRVIQDAWPRIQEAVARELEAQAPKTKRRIANDERYGAFYGTQRTMSELDVNTPQQLSDRVRRNTLLRVKLDGGNLNAFPALQFQNHKVIPKLKQVLQILVPAAATEWSVLRWLTLALPELGGQRPIDILRNETSSQIPAEAVIEAAQATARVWMQ